jgi:cell shape-determining protein MreC
MPKREPTSAEYQNLLYENDTLRVELAGLKAELAELKRLRKENMTYTQELWNDNQRVHSQLRYFNQCVLNNDLRS